MIVIPPPKNDPHYTPETRSIIAAVLRDARSVLYSGRRSYICHAITYAMHGMKASFVHDLILRRLGKVKGTSTLRNNPHTYDSWFKEVNGAHISAHDDQSYRILWLNALIKEFTDGS
jgi:hypothetical protein